jgi:ribosomal protein S18 acetylase RimI-like enzyme
MAEPTIRRATAADARLLADIGAALFRQTYAEQIPAAEIGAYVASDFGEEQQRAEIEDPTVVTLLAEAPLPGTGEDALVGFAQLRQKPLPTSARGNANVELWRIYVERDWHGRRVGQSLLRAVGEAARETLAATGIWLGVWEQNPRAISFYEKNGFEAVGHQEFRVGPEVHQDIVLVAHRDAF